MTSFNREKYIGEAIESVLASTYKNFELIIVDDCSKDHTVKIARSLENIDKRIKVFLNEKNVGDYPNRNIAAGYAKGEYIKYLDSDDKILPDGLEKCVNEMLRFPDADFGIYNSFSSQQTHVLSSDRALRIHFFNKPFLMIGPGGTIIRRKFFEIINGYPEKYGPANDLYFNLKASCNTSIVMLSFDFIFYRRHSGQEINNAYSYLVNNYTYLRDALANLPLQLSNEQLSWLAKKNKRRFLVNLFKYLVKSKSLPKTMKTAKEAGFKFKDIKVGLFH